MENKVRQVVVYKDFFQSFFAQQDRKVQDKIIKILDIIEQLERIPESYLKYLSETDGLYEIRVQLGKRIFRIFCFFDGERIVVLLCGFQKKTRKTPSSEIRKAQRLKKEYFEDKYK
ncbi:MAG: type II toxin-antitoxin system RelE/ParE family toxin [Bacteroidales bacterium]|nr:type II toxin-antitoxin system RelE/ParE family toxin [Bacteroidales bacterium]